MKNLLVVLVLIVAAVVGLGLYLGWFHVTSDSTNGKPNITITGDPEKFQEDKKKAQEKLKDLGHSVKDKAAAPTEKSKDQTTPPENQE